MLLVEDVKKIFNDLLSKKDGVFFLNDYDITIHVFDNATKFSLSTPIYTGESYIPESVRIGVKKISSLNQSRILKTNLKVDEKNYNIILSYLATTENFNSVQFIYIVEEFSDLATKWRVFLDDRDNQDLVYIHSKPK